MKKFKFKLESLLRYRSFQEHQKKLAVAAARFDVVSCEERIEEMIQATVSTEKALDAIMTAGVAAERFQRHRNYMNALAARRESEEAHRLELLKTLAQRQQELIERSVARKVVENLKARKREAYYQDAVKAEQHELDDLMILRAKGMTN